MTERKSVREVLADKVGFCPKGKLDPPAALSMEASGEDLTVGSDFWSMSG